MNIDPATTLLSAAATLREVMVALDRNRLGIVLIVDTAGRLIGTVTDGDIRRLLLGGGTLDAPAERAMRTSPVTAPADASEEQLDGILRHGHVQVVPVIDGDGRPVRLVTVKERVGHYVEETMAVIMAGGQGTRLRPLTDTLPKPLVPVAGEPILEGLLKGLASAGVRRVYIAVNYLRHLIEEHCGSGSAYGLRIEYLREEEARGTAGSLALLPETPHAPFLVLNGDIVTEVDFLSLRDYHQQHRAVLTVAAAEYSVHVPYGVLRLAAHHVLGVDEKPTHTFFCNAGLYVLNPEVLRFVPRDREYNMTDLLADVLRDGLPVAAFPIHERWIDVGRREQLERAAAMFGRPATESA